MNERDNQQRQEVNNHIEEEINTLTLTLLDLNIRQRNLRRQSLEIEQQLERLDRQRRTNQQTTAPRRVIRRDRHGDQLDIGDYVNFLTSGHYNTRSGTITQVSHRRYVSARDREDRIINREPANVEIVRNFNEQDDQRERFE